MIPLRGRERGVGLEERYESFCLDRATDIYV